MFEYILRSFLAFPVDLSLVLVDLGVVEFIFLILYIINKLMVFFKSIVLYIRMFVHLIECVIDIVPSTISHGQGVALIIEEFLFGIVDLVV